MTLEEASKTFRVMGKRPTGKKRFLMIIFTAPIIQPNHFSHSEEEILEMVREVSDDKKNDSLEFNEFIKVRLLLSIMMMMVCVVMMIIFDVSSFNQMVALSLKREPSQNKRELLEAFQQFDKYDYFDIR